MKEFREKPDAATAEEYVASGRYLWNSGMFMFCASRFLTEVEAHAPAVLAATKRALVNAERDGNVTRLDAEAFATAPSISVDYAVMEHTASAAVVPIHTGWSDVGSWNALWELGHHDELGNVTVGDVELVDVHNSYVRSDGRFVAAIGLDNVVVVDSRDATLVVRRDRSQDVKTIVDRLTADNRTEVVSDGTEDRGWGSFATLAGDDDSQVLHLRVDPGASLPRRTLDGRTVHWIVTRGTARVQIGDNESALEAGESATIPPGVEHAAENSSATETLDMVEIGVALDTEGDR